METNRSNITDCSTDEPLRGNNRHYALRQLRVQAPEVYARVMAEYLSPPLAQHWHGSARHHVPTIAASKVNRNGVIRFWGFSLRPLSLVIFGN